MTTITQITVFYVSYVNNCLAIFASNHEAVMCLTIIHSAMQTRAHNGKRNPSAARPHTCSRAESRKTVKMCTYNVFCRFSNPLIMLNKN